MKHRFVSFWSVGVIALALATPTFSHAALITFTAGNGSVVQGGSVLIPITVSYGNPGEETVGNWISADFVLTLSSPLLTMADNGLGTVINPSLIGADFNPVTGAFSYVNGTGFHLAEGDTILTVSVSAAVNAPLGNSSIGFSPAGKQVGYLEIPGDAPLDTDPDVTGGTINVTAVPEPITYALGFFGCLFVGAAAVRRFAKKNAA